MAATLHPSRAKRSAVARPIPLEAPVITTVFAVSLAFSFTGLRLHSWMIRFDDRMTRSRTRRLSSLRPAREVSHAFLSVPGFAHCPQVSVSRLLNEKTTTSERRGWPSRWGGKNLVLASEIIRSGIVQSDGSSVSRHAVLGRRAALSAPLVAGSPLHVSLHVRVHQFGEIQRPFTANR